MFRLNRRARVTRKARALTVIRTAVEPLELRTFLSAAGDLDASFGVGGKVLTDFPTSTLDAARSTALQSDGRIVTLSGGTDPNSVRLARYTANGLLDTTFGANGSTIVPFPVATLAVRADNRIVLAGAADANSVRIARYTAAGQPDATFGNGVGQVTQPYFGGPVSTAKSISRLLIEPDSNRIYIAGTALRDTYDFALAAFNEDGSRYDFFGNDGQYNTFADFGHVDFLNDAALAPNGDIVAVGSWTVSDSHHPYYAGDYAIVRWNQSGIPDSSFGGGTAGTGRATVQFGVGQDPDSLFDTAQSVAFDAAGNIVVAGRSVDPQDDIPFLTSVARLTPNGALDPTFSPGGPEGDGRALLPLTDASFDTVNTVAVLPSGKILVGSAAPGASGDDFVLARLTATGALDTTFGVAGKVTTDFGADDRPRTLLIQSGKALLAGASTLPTANPGDAQSRLAIARYTLDDAAPQAPFTGRPISVPGTLQFEDFDDGGEGVAYHDTDPANVGAAYRLTGVDLQPAPVFGTTLAFAKAGEWVEYTVNATQGGTYDVDLYYASLKGGGRFHLEADGQPLTPVTTVTATGDWQKYQYLRIGGVNLAAGQHVLRLVMDANDSTGYVANFDFASFARRVPPPGQTPFNGTPFSPPGRLQLEDFDNGGEGLAYHDTDSVNQSGAYRTNTGVDVEAIPVSSGGGFNLGYAKAGEWTEYTFVAPDVQGASYDLALVYAAPRGGAVSIEIDGQSLGPPVTLRDTPGWQDYRTAYPAFDVRLTPGTHVLRLAQVQNGAYGYVANFDYLDFLPYREPFNHTPFRAGDTIQAEDFDFGGEGLAYHDTDRANLGNAAYRRTEGVDIETATDAADTLPGLNVGFAKAGEWLEYNIANGTAADATVGIDVRIASLRAGGKFHFEIDGKTVATFTTPATGSWQTYTTLSSPKNIRLTPGGHTLRLVMDQTNSTGYVANFNWLRFHP